MDSSSDNPNSLTASGGANSGGPVNAGAPNSDGSLRIDHHVHHESPAQPALAEPAAPTPTPAEPFVENSVPVEPTQSAAPISEPAPSVAPAVSPSAGPVTSEATPVPTSANVASESSFEQPKPTPAEPYVPEEEPTNAPISTGAVPQNTPSGSQPGTSIPRPVNPFSNRPMQPIQPVAPIGDEGIVIGGNEPPKKSKKKWIIVVVLVIAILAVIVVVLYANSKPGNNNAEEKTERQTELTEEQQNQVDFSKNALAAEDLEIFMADVYNKNLGIDVIMSGSVHTNLNNNLESFKKMDQYAKNYKGDELKDDFIEVDLKCLREKLDKRTTIYSQTVELYNKIYDAVVSENYKESLTKLESSQKDKNIAEIIKQISATGDEFVSANADKGQLVENSKEIMYSLFTAYGKIDFEQEGKMIDCFGKCIPRPPLVEEAR